MPYPNEHACRLQPPGNFSRFARGKRSHNGKQYSVIFGVRNNKSQDQAYRYPKTTWSASEARAHCGSYNGSFEAAKKTED